MTSPARARVAAVVLAAGSSRRMGVENKLLARLGDRPLVAVVVDTLRRARGVHRVVVVTGHGAEDVEAALTTTGGNLSWVHNPHHERGMGTSLAAGVSSLLNPGQGAESDAVLVCLGDMPLVQPEHVDALIERFADETGPAICVPVFEGERGHPVLFSRHFFAELCALSGDRGARGLLRAHAEAVREVKVADRAVLVDVDTPQALDRVRVISSD